MIRNRGLRAIAWDYVLGFIIVFIAIACADRFTRNAPVYPDCGHKNAPADPTRGQPDRKAPGVLTS